MMKDILALVSNLGVLRLQGLSIDTIGLDSTKPSLRPQLFRRLEFHSKPIAMISLVAEQKRNRWLFCFKRLIVRGNPYAHWRDNLFNEAAWQKEVIYQLSLHPIASRSILSWFAVAVIL